MCATHILCHWQHVAHNVPHLLLTQSNQNTASFLFQRIQSAVTPGKRRTEPSCSVCCLVMMHHRRDYTSIQSFLHPHVSSTLPRQTFQSVVQVSANNKASSGWNHGMNEHGLPLFITSTTAFLSMMFFSLHVSALCTPCFSSTTGHLE